MRMKKPAVALATAALMTLAACGGGSGTDTPESDETVGAGTGKGGEAGSFKNPDAEAPLAMPDDATEGGTLTVLTANVPSTLDPTQAYYTDSTAILSDLVTRSLTQYVVRPRRPTTCSWCRTWRPTSAVPTRTTPSGRSRCVTA